MSNVIIIAEAGVNHNGNINLAFKLVDKAKNAGADYIKFQIFKTELISDKSASKANYQMETTDTEESQFDMIKKLELSIDDFIKIKDYCNKNDIRFLTSVGDLVSLDAIVKFNLDYMKVASGELTNILLLRKLAKTKKPILLSTGMATLGEIENAISILTNEGLSRDLITLLHCNTEYPTPYIDVNLKGMVTLADAFKLRVGYSDHTTGIEIPIAAVALGATVIEKHFTIDKSLPGPDHKASLEPSEFKNMVQAIRNTELALSGKGIKSPSKSEMKNIRIVRKSLFAAQKIQKGEFFSEKNIIPKRPGDGIEVIELDKVLGRKAAHNIKKGTKLSYRDIAW